jgi:nitrogen PTS system EIIA component
MEQVLQSRGMPFSILTADAIRPAVKASSKRQLLTEIAEAAATLTRLDSREVFDALLQRERLGSTGIGSGIAIPHAKFTGIERLHGLFFQLDRPVDFDSLDGQPVDLVFVLLAPEGAGADHLKGLARVARVLRDPQTARLLRQSRDPYAISEIFSAGAAPSQAA